MRNDVIYLVTESVTLDSYGVEQVTTEEQQVFCDVTSISSAEFFRAGENGIKPQLRFVLFSHEYNGESTVRYDGTLYSVYRTFQSGPDTVELYVEDVKGVTNNE